MVFSEFMRKNLVSGRISDISDITCTFFGKNSVSELTINQKLEALCVSMNISVEDLDTIISSHQEVSRTVKGHAFELIFDDVMSINGIVSEEVGGDSDVDRIVNSYSLQLKTPFIKGCDEIKNIISYKTHKTHGSKSESESMDYYHKVSDFADFLVGLVSYEPFHLLIIPKNSLPRVKKDNSYIEDPMYFSTKNNPYIDNYSQLGINTSISIPDGFFSLSDNELLPISSKMFDIKSKYLINTIFLSENFRIWDMNMRGFIREHVFNKALKTHNIKPISPTSLNIERSNKCDFILRRKDGSFCRFQMKGLTFKGCKLRGINSIIDCETQLSRGHVNDHPTQSRLYLETDFDYLIIAVDPSYTNALSIECFNIPKYKWKYYCLPVQKLSRHSNWSHRINSHQYIKYIDLQQYAIKPDWIDQFITD